MMIRIQDGELLDILPAQYKYDTDMICFSYALKKQMEKLLYYEICSMTQNYVDSLPEEVLDVLAVERRSPYYLQSLDIETKRELVKKSLTWNAKSGTPAAVEEMVAILFGEGSVIESKDFTEGERTPGLFDIETNARMTPDVIDQFMAIIKRVKNERSHLRRVLVHRQMGMHEKPGSGVITGPKVPVTNNKTGSGNASMHERAGGGAVSAPKVQFINVRTGVSSAISGPEHAAAGAVSSPKETIGNHIVTASHVSAHNKAASAACSVPLVRILNAGSAGRQIAQGQHLAAGAVSNSKLAIH